MHVAINGWFWGQSVGSGRYIHNLVRYLRRIEPDLKLSLIMPPHNPTPSDVPQGVDVITTGKAAKASKWGKVWFEQRTFPQTAKRIGADVAHVPYWASPLASPVPMVVSVLDIIPILDPVYSTGLFNRLYVSLVSTSARGADHVITISHTSKLDIEEHLYIPPHRVSVTYLAPEEHFHPRMGAERDEAVRAKYGLPERFVLYIGGFDKRKQVNMALLAHTYVIEGEAVPLVLAGREPAWGSPLFPDLRHYAEELNLSDSVQWLGFVDEADMPSLYRLASVFVYPSEYEGFGLQPLEAMACGTPVVTSDAVIFAEVLEDAAFMVADARSMAGAVIALLIQEPLRQNMVNQGLSLASQYNWRKTARETLAVYRKVVGD